MAKQYRLTPSYYEGLTAEQENSLYGYDEICRTKAEAIAAAKDRTKQFNEKFSTDYEWQAIIDIELQYLDEYGDIID